jgi:hypothetical protein
MSENLFELVCERNSNTEHLAMRFSAARGPIIGGGDCGTNVATGSRKSSTLGISQKLKILTRPPWHTCIAYSLKLSYF